jgi:hypothetical protein
VLPPRSSIKKTECYRAVSSVFELAEANTREPNMRRHPTQKSYQLVATFALLAAAITLFDATDAAAQPYYYQPSPGYYQNDTAAGTVTGGALGAVTGAIIGGKDNRGEGALVGLGVGALTGNLLGRSKDRADEVRAVYGATAVGQLNQQAAAQAVTNYDL